MILFMVSPVSLRSLATVEEIALVNSQKVSLVTLCRRECRTLCKNSATLLPFYSYVTKRKRGINFILTSISAWSSNHLT